MRWTLTVLVLAGVALADDTVEGKLTKLKGLCDKGLLSEEECKEQRKKLIALLDEELAKPDEKRAAWFCNYAGEQTLPTAPSGKAFSESASAGIAVREILDAAGLVGNFVVQAAGVPNAMASVRMGSRFIEYNPTFVEQLKIGTKTNWAVYSVLAHEIGHHLQGHTVRPGGSRPDLELEADEYSGFIMNRLGASLADAQKAMQTFGSDTSSGTHPDKKSRLIAIKKGWDNAAKKKPDVAPGAELPTVETPLPQTLPPPLQPTQNLQFGFKCVVNGEQVLIDQNNRVLSVPKQGLQVAQRVPSGDPNCAFLMAAPPTGVYCVAWNGYVFFAGPAPVGQCVQCGAYGCP